MATAYLSSVDGNDGTTPSVSWWNGNQPTYATLAAALTAAGNGGRVYVDNAHAESGGGTISLTSPGTAPTPVTILTVTRATGSLAAARTASVTTTGGAINFSGFAYCWGIQFINSWATSNPTINFTPTDPWWWKLEGCSLSFTSVNASGTAANGINIGVVAASSNAAADDELLEWVDVQVRFSHVNQRIRPRTRFRWTATNSAIQGATIPTTLFEIPAGNGRGALEVIGVDLSAVTTTIFDVSAAVTYDALLHTCTLGSGVTYSSGSVAGRGGVSLRFVNCDSGDTNYNYYKKVFEGDVVSETTIVRSGGASDGTTSLARKMVSSANSKFYSPLESSPITIWNETTGSSVTVTVEIVTDGVTLTDAEAWIEVEYLGTSGVPLASRISDRATDILATPANQTTSSVSWTTTGLTSPTKQKLSVSFTPQEKGLIRARVMLAKASTTMYFCPKLDVS